MNNEETLSVKEFAAAAHVSIQTIYKQLYHGGRLEPYSVLVKGKKRIKKEALEEYYDFQPDSAALNENQPDLLNFKPETQPDSLNSKPETQPDSTAIETAIKVLQEQLERKDQQIEQLTKDLHEAYKEIADMAKQAHYITAADKTEKIMQQQSKEEIIEPAAADNKEEIKEQPQQKKSFWQRLFKK